MTEIITLALPDEMARRAHRLAEQMEKPVSALLLEWIGAGIENVPVDQLPDAEVIALAQGEMPSSEQEKLSRLLAEQREGQLSDEDQLELEQLMVFYRRGMVRKAEALRVAVARKLLPPLA